MARAFVDTSFLLSLALGQRAGRAARFRIESFDTVFASRFLEAEYLCAFRRESVNPVRDLLRTIEWVDSTVSLATEISRVLDAGYLRGADCWHLATALSIAPDPTDWTFLTLDTRQSDVAQALGFQV